MGLVNAVMFSLQRHTTIVYLENLAVFKLSLSRHPAPRAQGNMLYYINLVNKYGIKYTKKTEIKTKKQKDKIS